MLIDQNDFGTDFWLDPVFASPIDPSPRSVPPDLKGAPQTKEEERELRILQRAGVDCANLFSLSLSLSCSHTYDPSLSLTHTFIDTCDTPPPSISPRLNIYPDYTQTRVASFSPNDDDDDDEVKRSKCFWEANLSFLSERKRILRVQSQLNLSADGRLVKRETFSK